MAQTSVCRAHTHVGACAPSAPLSNCALDPPSAFHNGSMADVASMAQIPLSMLVVFASAKLLSEVFER
ncbi:MAG TPA: hypothetical protein VGF59_31435, partial [Bryobacteraceae bacterium]